MRKHTPPTAKTAVRVWLASKGRTQVWLAGRLGITQGALSNILNGHEAASDKQAKAIARITGVDIRAQVAA